MRMRHLLVWIAVGLVGLALAAGVTYAATQLSSQRIGLSAEPPSAGEELAPPHAAPRPRTSGPSRTTTTTEPAAPSQDDNGSERGRNPEERHEGASGGSDWDD
jgi:hypothetical protein